ncbi:CTTNBP2 N-terminal like b [Latimeria chalumnae]|nr:PREDICTED: CTTNBP2 N-terminal-like protein [Latimeria chalumnae]|eukprot:XP_005987701.1 PREDICTED: CTTNBP2 N-terminal-like protein [Latimeria chalumnae]
MNMENLSKSELLMLFSVLEGELEARDLVIETLRAQHRETFIQERYGKYNLSDPFMALQRDFDILKADGNGEKLPVCSNPLSVLKVVMTQCKKMQERMTSQLVAAESRHKKVIIDLEEEQRRHAQDTAEGDDVTYMLEKERERLTQQLEFEKSQVKKVEKEQKKLANQLEEERSRHKQLSSVLAKECKKATNKATEESQRAADLSLKLENERSKVNKMEEELVAEKKKGQQMEAQMEKQLSEFDIEREQLRAKLNREENRTKALKMEVESLKKIIEELQNQKEVSSQSETIKREPILVSKGIGPEEPSLVSTFCQTEIGQSEATNEYISNTAQVTATKPATLAPQYAKLNGHCSKTIQRNGDPSQISGAENQILVQSKPSTLSNLESTVDGGSSPSCTGSPVHVTTQQHTTGTSLSPSSTAASSLTSSPCSSPVLARRAAGSPVYQSSYQAGLNQRFHAARHKFQAQAEQDQQGGCQSPSRDLSPTTVDHSTAKQMARNTVTQVLSRFTSQQGSVKPISPNSSPFGTDYRNLANTTSQKSDTNHSPTASKVSSPLSPLSPGIKSPTIPRAERGNPPPIPPKKPGLAQAPPSPNPLTKTSNMASSLNAAVDISNSCGVNTVMVNGKEADILLPTNS